MSGRDMTVRELSDVYWSAREASCDDVKLGVNESLVGIEEILKMLED